LFFKYF
jgi:hypothetical protein